MSHALARLARHRVWADSHTFGIHLRSTLPWLLGAAGWAVAVLADAAPVAQTMPVSAGPVSDLAIVLLTLLGLFGLTRLHGMRLLDHGEVDDLQSRAQTHPETTRIVATWIELDLSLRLRDRRALERALAALAARH